MKSKAKKLIFIIAGSILLVIGGIGILVPFLPTTPFVILAAACFSSSSEKLYSFLMKSKYFGSYIDNYKNRTGVPRETKIKAIIFLWITLGISMMIMRSIPTILVLTVVGIGVTIHISSLKVK